MNLKPGSIDLMREGKRLKQVAKGQLIHTIYMAIWNEQPGSAAEVGSIKMVKRHLDRKGLDRLWAKCRQMDLVQIDIFIGRDVGLKVLFPCCFTL